MTVCSALMLNCSFEHLHHLTLVPQYDLSLISSQLQRLMQRLICCEPSAEKVQQPEGLLAKIQQQMALRPS